MKRIIENQWKVTWELIENVEEIRGMLQAVQGEITQIFREGNLVADALTNKVIELQESKEYRRFIEIPVAIRRCINMDKIQISNLRIRTRKINKQ